MEQPNGLDLLALEAGIELGYNDHRGVFRQVSDATKMALLQDMGLLAQGENPETALARLRRQDRRNLLPPVLVRPADDPVQAIPLVLDPEEIGKKLHYYLAVDQGGSFSGEVEGDLLRQGAEPQNFLMQLRHKLAPGYHRLSLHTVQREASLLLILAPSTCYLPERLAQHKERLWGVTLGLATLRSATDWGVGDFGNLERCIDLAAGIGGDAVGLAPLHVMGPDFGVCTPSTRFFVDPLYLDLTRIADCSTEHFRDPEFSSLIAACRATAEIDYGKTAELKRQGLAILFRDFRKYHLATGSDRSRAFRMFKAEGGQRLLDHATFFALRDRFAGAAGQGWRSWPEGYHRPDTDEVCSFVRREQELIELHCYILWQCELQAAACGERSFDRHLGIGLCPEIAAGVHPDGAEVWALQPLHSRTATLGAPPDEDHPQGRDFRLAPPNPRRLTAAGYEPFAAMLRSTMRHAGAVLLDRPMQMMHQFWIPAGGSPGDGAYVRYPLEDLLGVIALESRRNNCMVMAREHPLPEHFAQQLQEKKIFHYAFLFPELAERGEGPPADVPGRAVATIFAPDRPTLAGFWQGLDLEQEGLAAERFEEALARRQTEKKAILAAIEEEELLPPGTVTLENEVPELTDALNRAIHRYLARRPALVVMACLEDIFRLREKGSRLSPTLDDMQTSSVLADFAAAVGRERTEGGFFRERRGRKPLAAIIPRATYRLQMNRGFTFAQAAEIIPYLADLGISHCYTSPCFAARAGSTHGYDVVDPNDFNPEIGGMDGYDAFHRRLAEYGLGQVMDIVPNHMGVMGSDNVWWLDVLENGRSSAYAQYFDIDWRPVKTELHGKLLVPVLGEPYGVALTQGNLKLCADIEGGAFFVSYYHHRFPLDPRTYPLILNRRLDILEIRMGQDEPFFIELLSLITAFGQLSPPAEADPKKILIRRRDKEVLKGRLAALAGKCPDIGRHLVETAEEYNSRAAESANLRDFHVLLEEQCFRPAYWRVAADEINYRRFFDINDLASLCVEKQEVFDATHRLIFRLVRQGRVEGLRVDHPDGLFEPAEYYRRLFAALQAEGEKSETDEAPVYLVVEKILAQHEHLSPEWPVHGTTGYDFVFQVNNLFIDSRAEARMTRIYRRFTRLADDFDTVLYRSKKKIMRLVLASELSMLANRLDRLSERNWRTRDFTHNNLREALAEVAACFPVYRTYVTEKDLTAQDRNFIDWAVAQAKRNSVASDLTIFDFIRSVLLSVPDPDTDREFRQEAVDFAMRFQQFTAPVMAKGMEDTAFYIYNRLVSQNEVGGDPRRFGISVAAFHRLCRDRADHWPSAMLATSTHDSKRSEDARCRLNVLSEVADEWQKRLTVWGRMNDRHARMIDEVRAPSANDEYLLYQILLAVWPLDEEGEGGERVAPSLRMRVTAYMEKACREAKVHSSWSEPNPAYEKAVASFIEALLTDGDNPFLEDFLPFQRLVSRLGMYNGLSQCLLKLTVPGVPDIYQGCELWNLYLVDPDNRQPVDYVRARAMLSDLKKQVAEAGDDGLRELAANVLATMADGRIKLYLVWRLLVFRREHDELFRQGSYIPLAAGGPFAEHVCGFARRLGKKLVVVICARFFAALTGQGQGNPCGPVWAGTFLEAPVDGEGTWSDILTGQDIQAERVEERDVLLLDRVFAILPVAFLEFRQAG
ncbi:MAG: hypothetical protein A2X81_14930 [Desulfobacterales bacterium GWB2_56_26]|nr:MAG: hypothetical protein A2X81_14930 [Desulfobacterales bacterium GWB2_56_26]